MKLLSDASPTAANASRGVTRRAARLEKSYANAGSCWAQDYGGYEEPSIADPATLHLANRAAVDD